MSTSSLQGPCPQRQKQLWFTWALYGRLGWENCCVLHLRRVLQRGGAWCCKFFSTYFPLQPHYSYFAQLAVETVNQLAFPRQAYPSNNKASINNPLPLHELRDISPNIYFILVLNVCNPKLCSGTVTWASVRYCNCTVCVTACVCVCT